MEKHNTTIAITTSSFAQFSTEPLDKLKSLGIAYKLNQTGRVLEFHELVDLLQGCSGVIAGTEAYTQEVFAALPELRVISRCGAGIDSINLPASVKAQVAVINTPDAPTRAVAELTVGLAMNLLRNIGEMDAQLHAGQWKKHMGSLIHEKAVGIIGFGRIGRASASLFSALGCRIYYHDPYVHENDKYTSLLLPELLQQADIICLHMPQSTEAKPVIGADELALMKQGSWLINTARGSLVDETALLDALEAKHLAGAALDVFAVEPYIGPLASHPKVIATPHVGSYAKESRIGMEVEAANNLLRELGIIP